MNVLAFGEEVPVDTVAAELVICYWVEVEAAVRTNTFFLVPLVPTFLPSLLKFEVEVEIEYWRISKMEMVKIANFVILHLFEMLSGLLADWLC